MTSTELDRRNMRQWCLERALDVHCQRTFGRHNANKVLADAEKFYQWVIEEPKTKAEGELKSE